MAKKISIGASIMFISLAVLALRPVPIVSEDQALVEKGIVAKIFTTGESDIVFQLENNSRTFYINRGLENGLTVDGLSERLIGHEVVVLYPNYWTPLDWKGKVRHLSKMTINGETIYSEISN